MRMPCDKPNESQRPRADVEDVRLRCACCGAFVEDEEHYVGCDLADEENQ